MWQRIRRPLGWLLLAFFIYAIFKSPDQAASMVGGAWDGIKSGLAQIGKFFDALLNR